MQITFKNNNSDSLTLIDYLHFAGAKIESIQFADGTNWGMDYVYNLVTGDHQNDYIQGTTADDTLYNSADDQYLDGYKGSDTYQFSLGDGHDVIEDKGWLESEQDRIVFGEGITPEGVVLRRDNNDLIIDFVGHSDWLTVKGQLHDYYRTIETFIFADGTEWLVDASQGINDFTDITDNKDNNNPVAQDDTGFSAIKNESLIVSREELLANDSDVESNAFTIMAVGNAKNGQVRLLEDGSVQFTPDENYTGTASFQYNLHDARGGVSESATASLNINNTNNGEGDRIFNTLEGTSGDDIINGLDGHDYILGYSGNDRLIGGKGDDLLRGGRGNDTLTGDNSSGDWGSDTFILAAEEGTDTITDFQAGIDFIGLADGLTFGALTLEKDENDTLIQFDSNVLSRVSGVELLGESNFITV